MKHLLLIGALAFAACGDDGGNIGGNECGAGTSEVDGECVADAVCGDGTVLTDGICIPDGTTPPRVFTQVEHLARPGINEALLLSDGFNAGYNATAPTFTGVPQATLDQVVAEAKTVLKAIYLGSCLVSGVLGLQPDPDAGEGALDPGLVECAATGGAIFVGGNPLTGTQLTDAAKTGAQTYADRMFAQFIPDVMRIDTTGANNYLSPCGDPTASSILLCGGRRLNDDVIDVPYNYLIGGLRGTAGPQDSNGPGNTALVVADQVRALTSDGVAYQSNANAGQGNNLNGLTDGVPSNGQQGHPTITSTFPYSATPF